jgi:Na+/H+ antiporter NhaD/arsenite permease-like protein
MSDEKSSPPPPPADAVKSASTARQRATVYFGCALLVSYAVILLAVPTPKLSPPLRVGLAAGNLIAAAVLWLIARQNDKSGG